MRKNKQKFPRGTYVKVADKLPESMSHFESGFEGIVEYTYYQEYGGDAEDKKEYSLIQLDKDGEPINSLSWYDEDQLTLVCSDVVEGKRVIEAWNYAEEES